MLILPFQIEFFMVKEYRIYTPAVRGTVENEWEQCRDQISEDVLKGLRPVKLNIFINVPGLAVYTEKKQFIARSVIERFSDQCPAFNVSIHPPEEPFSIVVEALFSAGSRSGITTRFLGEFPYVVVETDDIKEVWSAGLGSDQSMDDTRKSAEAAFEIMGEILERENLSFNNIVRQWNFIGDILGMRDGFQNYQVFNEVRTEYYNKYRTTHGFPAATGVGMKFGGVFLDFCAISPDETVRIQPISNPSQINAYEYGQEVLKGQPLNISSIKHPPQFERGLLLVNKSVSTLFVSGTASIIGQDTIGRGDVAEQTVVTIENIRKVADMQQISTLTCKSGPGRYSLLRVYIKRQEDFSLVREICNEQFKGSPMVFIEADICRDDLLTEIEAELSL